MADTTDADAKDHPQAQSAKHTIRVGKIVRPSRFFEQNLQIQTAKLSIFLTSTSGGDHSFEK